MLTAIIILWILWRLCHPWYGNWHRPPMGPHHYHHATVWHHHAPMGGYHGGGGFGGFHDSGFGGAFGGGGRTMGAAEAEAGDKHIPK